MTSDFFARRVIIRVEPATLARMHGINLRAIILASLAVFGVDILSTSLLLSLFIGPELGPDITNEQIQAAMEVLLQDGRYLTSTLILGTASTILGGFLAARLARTVPYFNALAFGVLGLVISLLSLGDSPVWFKAIGLTLTLPAALLGGYLAKQGSQAGGA